MRAYSIALICVILCSCDTYPDIEKLPPEEALAALNRYERDLNETEAAGDTIGPPPVPFTGAAAALAALDPLVEELDRQAVATARARIAADRQKLLSENPSLQAATQSSALAGFDNGSTTGAQFERPGATSDALAFQLSGRCGLPKNQTSDANRRVWHTEAIKGTFSQPYQTVAEIEAELNANGGATCEEVGRQVYAFMPSYRQAVTASNTIVNEQHPIGLRCLEIDGAGPATACTAVSIMYGIRSVSALCHRVCENSRQ